MSSRTLFFWIVHQTENTDRTGSDVKVLFHKFRFGKGKAGAADLLGESGCFELLLPEGSADRRQFSGYCEETGFCRFQCLKDYLLPGMLHSGKCVMVCTGIGDSKGV